MKKTERPGEERVENQKERNGALERVILRERLGSRGGVADLHIHW